MKTRILFLLLAGLTLAGQNVRSRIAGHGITYLPTTAPFNNLAELRMEFRISNFTSGRVASIGSIFINVVDSRRISATSFYDGGEAAVVTLPAHWPTDVIMRVQRDTVRKQFRIEAWRADGSEYIAGGSYSIGTAGANVSGEFDIAHNGGGGGVLAGTLAWVRVFTNCLPADGAQPVNQPATALLAYELENNGLDSGTANVPLTMGGSPAYAATPVIPQVGEPRTVRAGKPFTVNCADTGAASYEWQQLSGPVQVSFSNRRIAAPQVTGADVFGEYRLQCTAVDASGASGATVLPVGAVATNEAGVVIPPTDEISFLLAPMLRGDSSPWPFYDRNRRRVAAELGPAVVAAATGYISTPQAGTVSVNNGSTTVTGNGTLFLSQYGAGGQIVLYYVHADGQIGRKIRVISSVASNTSLTLSAPWDKPNQTGIQHQRWGTGDGGDANLAWIDSLNYYDNVLSLYISYYKTGLSSIAQSADQLALLWWLYLDLGDGVLMAPRLVSLEGMMLAAERGVLNKTAVYTAAQYFSFDESNDAPGYRNYIFNRNTSTGYQNFYYGARESGYAWRFGSELGRLHPVAATRAAWLPRLSTNIQNHYRDYQCKASNPALAGRCRVPEGPFRWQDDFRGGGFVGGYAEEPWHTGIAMQGIIRYHRWSGNATAATVITAWVSGLVNNTQSGGPAGASGMYMLSTPSSFAGVNCRRHYYTSDGGSESVLTPGLMQGSGCLGGADAVYGGRDSNNEMISSYGYAYRLTSNPVFKTRGDDVFGATWGADDGFHGQWAWRNATNRYKTHGQALCCADSYLVDRLPAADASTAPDLRPLLIAYRMSAVPAAASVRVTVTRPNAATVTASCTVSPCTVNIDRVQGRHRVMIEYLASSGAVVSASDWFPIEVRQ